jgi:hypothetical protein
MAHQVTYGENRLPQVCGDLTRYDSWCAGTTRQCIFVNGIMNGPEDHAATAKGIAHLTAASVLGVFNRSGLTHINRPDPLLDLGVDLLECIQDSAAILAGAVGIKPALTLNKSVRAPYYLLRLTGNTWPMSPLVIVAHSQGNRVVSNALFLYSHTVSKHGLRHPDIHVVGLASPAPSWPTNDFITVKLFSHMLDVVPYLAFGRSGVGFTANSAVPYIAPPDTTVSAMELGYGAETYLDDRPVMEWLWQVLKTPVAARNQILKEMDDVRQQKLKKAREAAARFTRLTNTGPRY